MDITPAALTDFLLTKKVPNLYHANSVLTSCQYLRHASLISRGSAERRGIPQTPQASDVLDQNARIWFDVFADSDDIHKRASRANVYGPVTLVLDTQQLLATQKGEVWVTKSNPTKWNKSSPADRWFSSAKDLATGFSKGTFDFMIVFRNCGGEVSIRDCLKEVILDNPKVDQIKPQVDFFSMAYGALKLCAAEGQIAAPIRQRACAEKCSCVADYQANLAGTGRMYRPFLKA